MVEIQETEITPTNFRRLSGAMYAITNNFGTRKAVVEVAALIRIMKMRCSCSRSHPCKPSLRERGQSWTKEQSHILKISLRKISKDCQTLSWIIDSKLPFRKDNSSANTITNNFGTRKAVLEGTVLIRIMKMRCSCSKSHPCKPSVRERGQSWTKEQSHIVERFD
ncbi:hypothetical protein DICVIV_13795 [Dictyocaulus viviparus]|uniref:Uncharacterized protein n=1 Tax=Dictyocaulus viviparus TaxID=29172 RepID=A0A0D8X9G2_DICVI|nr:hypothetical protein DICVIV_13795 [Dictyocaulus viviparus]